MLLGGTMAVLYRVRPIDSRDFTAAEGGSMRKEKTKNEMLMDQFRAWAKGLLKVNPEYVKDPERLIPYIKGPNWDAPDVSYAHYRSMVSMYGRELLDWFEGLRSLSHHEACETYKRVLWDSGALDKEYQEKALKRAEEIGVIEYNVNLNLMEYWSFYESEGWYFVRYDLDSKTEVFRGANIPFNRSLPKPIPAFLLSKNGGCLYNYCVG